MERGLPGPDAATLWGGDKAQRPLLYPEHHIGLFCQFVGVGDYHNAFSHSMGALFENFRDVLGGVLVQIAGRLVRQDHRSLACQGTGDGHPLLLAAGELQHISLGFFFRQAKPLQNGQRRQLGSQRHVLRRGQVVDEVVRLEDERYMVAPVICQSSGGDVSPIKQNSSAKGEYIANFQAVFRCQLCADEDFILIVRLDMAASQQRIFLIQKHIRKPRIPHSGCLTHVAGLIVPSTRQEVKLFAFGIAIMLRIVGFHLPLGSVDHLVNALLGDHGCCPFTESAILPSHLRIGPDSKGSTDI